MLVVFVTFFSGVILLLVLSGLAVLMRGMNSLPVLRIMPVALPSPCPLVSIVVPARNEERNIQRAVTSMLQQDYPNLEVIAIDDRSTDATSRVLANLADRYTNLRYVRVDSLPARWLGKNHALWLGARQSRGQLLLFTDADVVMHRQAVSKAVTFLHDRQLDHLTLLVDTDLRRLSLRLFTGTFAVFFLLYLRPWRVSDPSSSASAGIGAFNLVRRDAYCAIGTHRAIAMRPDDDLKLGELIKRHGYHQELGIGAGLLSVEWYASFSELVTGLMKNMFAVLDYRLWRVALVTVLELSTAVWPFLAALALSGPAQLINAMTSAAILAGWWLGSPASKMNRWFGVAFPGMTLVLVYIQWRAAIVTLCQRGIVWRGTYYPLSQLRANTV